MFVIALIIPAILLTVVLGLLTSYLVIYTRFLVVAWLEITITYTSILAEPVPVHVLWQLEITSAREAWPEQRHYQQIGSFQLHQLPFFGSNLSLDVGCQVVIALSLWARDRNYQLSHHGISIYPPCASKSCQTT